MKISVEWHGEAFNIKLASKEGAEPFLNVKGCRIKQHEDREYISFPARKMDNGKWWNHVWASDAFQEAVIAEARKTQQAPVKPKKAAADDDDIPF